jgi:hypothetical protein
LQAQRFDKYVCPACTIKRFYKNAYDEAVLAVERCVDPLARAQCRAKLRSRILRRLRKEEKTRDEASAFRDRMRAQAESGSVGGQRGLNAAAKAATEAAARAEAATRRAESIAQEEAAATSAEVSEDRLAAPTKAWAADAQSALKEYLDDDIFCPADARKPVEVTAADMAQIFAGKQTAAQAIHAAASKTHDARPALPELYVRLIASAGRGGLTVLEDVRVVIFALRASGWAALAVDSLREKRPIALTEAVLERAMSVPVNDDKVLRPLRNIVSKAAVWHGKVARLLMPGNAKLFDVAKLQALMAECARIPSYLPQEEVVLNIIEDGGKRYCLCRGASDGSYMIECGLCRKWFHGECVRVCQLVGDKLDAWTCPYCCDRRGEQYRFSPRPVPSESDDDEDSCPQVTEALRRARVGILGGTWDATAKARVGDWSTGQKAEEEAQEDYLLLLNDQVALEDAQGGGASAASSALTKYHANVKAKRDQELREQQLREYQREQQRLQMLEHQQYQQHQQMLAEQQQAQQQAQVQVAALQAQLEQQQQQLQAQMSAAEGMGVPQQLQQQLELLQQLPVEQQQMLLQNLQMAQMQQMQQQMANMPMDQMLAQLPMEQQLAMQQLAMQQQPQPGGLLPGLLPGGIDIQAMLAQSGIVLPGAVAAAAAPAADDSEAAAEGAEAAEAAPADGEAKDGEEGAAVAADGDAAAAEPGAAPTAEGDEEGGVGAPKDDGTAPAAADGSGPDAAAEESTGEKRKRDDDDGEAEAAEGEPASKQGRVQSDSASL